MRAILRPECRQEGERLPSRLHRKAVIVGLKNGQRPVYAVDWLCFWYDPGLILEKLSKIGNEEWII